LVALLLLRLKARDDEEYLYKFGADEELNQQMFIETLNDCLK